MFNWIQKSISDHWWNCESATGLTVKRYLTFSLFYFDGVFFEDFQPETQHPHFLGVLARYDGSPLAIGGGTPSEMFNKKTEILKDGLWNELDDYGTRYVVPGFARATKFVSV